MTEWLLGAFLVIVAVFIVLTYLYPEVFIR